MTVDVTFAMLPHYERSISEADLRTNLDQYRTELLKADHHEGLIFIRSSNESEQRLEDELRALVPSLCFESIPLLLNNQPAQVSFFTYYGTITLDPHDDIIILSGDHVLTAQYPRSELLPALFSCGWRFIQFLKRLHTEGFEEPISQIIEQSKEARLALEAVNYPVTD